MLSPLLTNEKGGKHFAVLQILFITAPKRWAFLDKVLNNSWRFLFSIHYALQTLHPTMGNMHPVTRKYLNCLFLFLLIVADLWIYEKRMSQTLIHSLLDYPILQDIITTCMCSRHPTYSLLYVSLSFKLSPVINKCSFYSNLYIGFLNKSWFIIGRFSPVE